MCRLKHARREKEKNDGLLYQAKTQNLANVVGQEKAAWCCVLEDAVSWDQAGRGRGRGAGRRKVALGSGSNFWVKIHLPKTNIPASTGHCTTRFLGVLQQGSRDAKYVVDESDESLMPQTWGLWKTSPVPKAAACGGWCEAGNRHIWTTRAFQKNVMLPAMPVGIPAP